MEFYNERNLTAHKEHICFICNTVIPVNQKYIRCSGKYEGDFFDLCFHENCNKLLNAFLDNSYIVLSIKPLFPLLIISLSISV